MKGLLKLCETIRENPKIIEELKRFGPSKAKDIDRKVLKLIGKGWLMFPVQPKKLNHFR